MIFMSAVAGGPLKIYTHSRVKLLGKCRCSGRFLTALRKEGSGLSLPCCVAQPWLGRFQMCGMPLQSCQSMVSEPPSPLPYLPYLKIMLLISVSLWKFRIDFFCPPLESYINYFLTYSNSAYGNSPFSK